MPDELWRACESSAPAAPPRAADRGRGGGARPSGIALEELRLADKLGTGVHMVILLGAGALIYWLGAQAPNEDGQPPAYQSVLLVIGLLLLYAALLTLADVLGADFDHFPPGAFVWTSLPWSRLALWPALRPRQRDLPADRRGRRRRSRCSPAGAGSSTRPGRRRTAGCCSCWRRARARLAGAARTGAAARGAARQRGRLAIAAIGVTASAGAVVESFGPFGSSPDAAAARASGRSCCCAAGFGLIAYGALDRAPGPAYLGVAQHGAVHRSRSRSRRARRSTGGRCCSCWSGVVMLGAGPAPAPPAPARAARLHARDAAGGAARPSGSAASRCGTTRR